MDTLRSISTARSLVQRHRLGDLLAARVERVERGHRLLEDHRDVVAADALHLGLAELEQVAALEADLPADDAARRVGDQAQDRQRRHALATARFAHHPQRLAAFQGVGHPVDGTDHAHRGEEMCLEVLHLQDGLCRLYGGAAHNPRRRLARIHARLPEFYRVSLGPYGEWAKPSEHIVLGLQKAKWP
jgi:hypothetical protein